MSNTTDGLIKIRGMALLLAKTRYDPGNPQYADDAVEQFMQLITASNTHLLDSGFKKYFEANLLDGTDITESSGTMLSAQDVYEVMGEYFSKLLDLVDDGVPKYKRYNEELDEYQQGFISGENLANSTMHAHIAEVRRKYE